MKKIFLVIALVIGLSGAALGQWEACNNGLDSSKAVFSLIVSDNKILIGSYGGGVFLSTNNGSYWQSVNQGFTGSDFNIISLAINGNYIFAGTDARGIFLSTTFGNNWHCINNDLSIPDDEVLSIVTKDNYIFVGSDGAGVDISSDNGSSWHEVNNGLLANYVSSFLVNGNNIFAGTLNGVFFSSDNGNKWSDLNQGLNGSAIEILVSYKNNIYTGTYGNGIYLSTNNGANWNSLGLTKFSVLSIAIEENNIFAGTWGEGVFLSTNNGSNWKEINHGLNHLKVNSLKINDNYIFAGTDSGVFRANINDLTDVQEPPTPSQKIFTIFPNPATDFLNISGLQGETVQIFSIEGEKLIESNVGTQRAVSLQIDVSVLPVGIYIIKVGTNVKKFVKL